MSNITQSLFQSGIHALGNGIGDTAATRFNGAEVSAAGANNQLTQEDFFTLLTQQLAYQDPANPVDNAEMISQMTAMTTADGINQLNSAIGDLNVSMSSSMALQASALVGRQVLIPSDQGYLGAGQPLSGVAVAPQTVSNLQISIEDSYGNVVDTLSLGSQAGGNVPWSWDGSDANGNAVPPGVYTIRANARVGAENQELPVANYGKVDSVLLGNSGAGTMVNLQGLGGILLSDVLEVAGG